jgi:hypothetical protein
LDNIFVNNLELHDRMELMRVVNKEKMFGLVAREIDFFQWLIRKSNFFGDL